MQPPGTANRPKFIPVMRPKLPSAERLLPYLLRLDATRTYSNHGALSAELEQRIADLTRLPAGGVVSASCGTTALMGAILASAGRGTPDRPYALLPAFTFVATASAVEQCGYRAWLADIDADTWMLGPDRIADHPELGRIGVVVPVGPFGRPVPQAPWEAFSRRTGIPVVIDGAASFERLVDEPDRFLGAVPVVLSFHATKTFATGEGGAVATTDVALAQRIVRALNFGFFGARDSQAASLNGKMSEYHAAVGLAELDDWPAKQVAFRTAADHYRRLLREAGLAERFFAAPDLAGCYAVYRCADASEAAAIQQTLDDDHVDYRLWYGEGLHRQPYYADLPSDALPATDELAPILLGLPMAPDLSSAAIGRVVAAIARGCDDCRAAAPAIRRAGD